MAPPQRLVRRGPRFRDRFFTRRTAEAILAPSSILAAGAGVAAGILIAGPAIGVAAALGAVAYAGTVLAKMPRAARSTDSDIDPRRLREPWRQHVREALEAEQRFAAAVSATPDGPLHDRLDSMGERVAAAVNECWRIANRGQQLEEALAQLGSIDQLQRKLARATSDGVAKAIRSQIDTYGRIAQTAIDARERLQLLEARLDESVARAVEVGLRAGDPVEIGLLDDDIESVVTEMEALRRGMEETAGHAVSGA